jgi:predicted membrane-bound dolichyl-phosphate-mannose-protein mannosyltransferase
MRHLLGGLLLFILWLVFLLTSALFAIAIPRHVYRCIRSGKIEVNRRSVRRSRHPWLFWAGIGIFALFWAASVRTLFFALAAALH